MMIARAAVVIGCIAAAAESSAPVSAQEAGPTLPSADSGKATSASPPRISVTEAQLLATTNEGDQSPYWVVTFQHFSTWKHGSNFFFLDISGGDNLEFFRREVGLYFEYAPVISLRQVAGLSPGAGRPLGDIGLTAQINTGRTPEGFEINRVFLEGVDLAWRVPGFVAFDTQLLARQEKGYGSSWQLTWVYEAPFTLGGTSWRFRGFLDLWRRRGLASRGTRSSTVLLAQPQLLVDVGTGSLQLGVELEPSHAFPLVEVHPGWGLAVSPMVRWEF